MKRLLLGLLLAAALPLGAQTRYDLDNYSGLRSEGPVPADLKYSLNELYGMDKQRVRDYNDGKLANRDKVLTASYHINKLMASGRITYGDPITRMVERIADTLLKDYPDLRQQLRFYTVKSPEVNAFATGQGMIFVNTGLVAQVEDEAQLAFVISHEIVHYFRSHSTEMLVRKQSRNRGMDRESAQLRDFLKRHNRSKEMEHEADSLGLALFYMGSDYDKQVTDGVFDVLQYGYLPFDEVPFDTAYFNTPFFQLPHDRFLDELAPITARDDYNDSLSTHPNLLKRRTQTAAQLAHLQGGKRFVTLTESEFEEIRTLARFECVRLDLVYSEFARAFYDCYLLQHQYPDNQFIRRAMGQALYGIAKNKTYTSTSSVIGDFNEMEGEVQQAYYMFRQIKADEISLIAARYLWNTLKRYPDDPQLQAMTEDLFADLGSKHNLHRSFFLDAVDTAAAAPDTAASTGKSAKYARIKAKKRQQASHDFRCYAFTDLLQQDSAFRDFLPDALEGKRLHHAKRSKGRKNQFLYSPTYLVVKKNSEEIEYKRSYANEAAMKEKVEAVGKRLGMQTLDFSDQRLTQLDSDEQYNEWVDLNEWVGEFLQTRGSFPMHFYMQPQMDRLADKYDASVINLSVVLNVEAASVRPLYIFRALILPIMPVSLYQAFSNTEGTMVYSMLVDSDNGKTLAKSEGEVNLADHSATVKSQLYNAYANIDTVQHADGEKIKEPVPGYLGLRCALTADATFSLGFLDKDERWKPFIASPTFDLEYAIRKNSSLVLHYNLKNTGGEVAHPFTLHTFGFGYRSYKSNSLAPLGPYLGINVLCSHYVFEKGTAFDESSQNVFGIQFDMGRHYVLFDRMLIDMGMKYGITFGGSKGVFDGVADHAAGNALLSNLIMIKLGLGILPF